MRTRTVTVPERLTATTSATVVQSQRQPSICQKKSGSETMSSALEMQSLGAKPKSQRCEPISNGELQREPRLSQLLGNLDGGD